MRLRVKQGLSYTQTLPGAERNPENPWYPSTDHFPVASSADSRAEASSQEALSGEAAGNARNYELWQQRDDFLPSTEVDSAQEGTQLQTGQVVKADMAMTAADWAQQRQLEKMSSDSNSFRGVDTSAQQEPIGQIGMQDPNSFGKSASITDKKTGGDLADGATDDQMKGAEAAFLCVKQLPAVSCKISLCPAYCAQCKAEIVQLCACTRQSELTCAASAV